METKYNENKQENKFTQNLNNLDHADTNVTLDVDPRDYHANINSGSFESPTEEGIKIVNITSKYLADLASISPPANIEETGRGIVELYRIFGKMKMLRQWGGIVDICPDASPIISKCEVKGLYFNCGWGTGGFKATPGSANVFAHTIAKDEPHKINAAFNLDRFSDGRLIDEHGAAAVAH